MTTSDYISICSLLIAIAASIYSYLTNTKKYELTSQYRTELLSWYSETIDILIRLKFEAKNGYSDEAIKKDLLSRLSAKIEIGRFYFPNIDKGDRVGEEKPLAYRGYRSLMLDFLVFSYQVLDRPDAIEYLGHVEKFQRHFTSNLFEIIDPKSFLKETKRHTNKTFSNEFSIEDFIQKDPDSLDKYLRNLN
jgi:hypothetical protein